MTFPALFVSKKRDPITGDRSRPLLLLRKEKNTADRLLPFADKRRQHFVYFNRHIRSYSEKILQLCYNLYKTIEFYARVYYYIYMTIGYNTRILQGGLQ